MAQARKPAGSPGSTGGQFDHDPKGGAGDLPGLGAFHEEYGPGMMHERVGTLHLDHTDMDDKHLTHFRFRDATIAPDPGEGDFIEFETEHDRERWQSGVSLRDLR